MSSSTIQRNVVCQPQCRQLLDVKYCIAYFEKQVEVVLVQSLKERKKFLIMNLLLTCKMKPKKEFQCF